MSKNKKNPPEESAEESEAGLTEETAAGEAVVPAEDTEAAVEETQSDESAGEKYEVLLAAEKGKYMRLYAEYENYRKRSQKEREAVYADVRADTVTRFLPIYDNLVRAIANQTADEAYKKGVELILAGMLEIFEKLGVREVEALGQEFDPSLHNAIMHIEDPERGAAEIVEEFEKGFTLGDKVIRFSIVAVAN